MKTHLMVIAIALALSGCGGGSGGDDATPVPTPTPSPTPNPDGGGDNSDSLIEQCENSGCTIDDEVSTSSLTVTNAPITLTNNASIILE